MVWFLGDLQCPVVRIGIDLSQDENEQLELEPWHIFEPRDEKRDTTGRMIYRWDQGHNRREIAQGFGRG